MSLPPDVSDWVLDKPEEILESSLLVSLVDALLAQSELFEFPVILLSHRSESSEKVPICHFQSFEAVWCPIVHVVIPMIA